MEQGNLSSVEWFDGIGEYKIDWGPGYRIYLAQDGEQLIVLFGGGTKKRQSSDIHRARLLYLEYKQRKRTELEEQKAAAAVKRKKEAESERRKPKRKR